MAEDLFEEENGDEEQSSDKGIEIFADDDTAEESFENEEDEELNDDEELELSFSEDEIDELSEDEEIDDEVIDEVYAEEDEGDEDISDDEEPWIPLDDDELELSPSDEAIDVLSENEKIDDEAMDEAHHVEKDTVEDDDEEVELDLEETSEVESEEDVSDDEEAWIPLDEKELELSPSDEEIDALLEDEEIGDESLDEVYHVKEGAVEEVDEEVEIGMDSEMEESLDDKDIGVFANHMSEEAEAPPWDEGVEIPIHGAMGPPKKKKTFLIVGVFAVLALILMGLYAVFQYRPTLVEKDVKPEEERPLFVTKKMETTPVKESETEKKPEPEPMAMKINTAPTISGIPKTTVPEGAPYRFIPDAKDVDNGDRLIFFIANQPVWTNFDTSTGALTGTPGKEHVGTYENIVILVSDGTATASLPDFSITVTEVKPSLIVEERKTRQQEPQEKVIPSKPEEAKKSQPIIEAKKEELKKAEVGQYELPNLTDLVKESEYQDAALEYLKEVKQFPRAYSLKLEVDCADESLSTAFQQGNFDRRMFILPKDIRGKNCFIVFWGLFATKMEAIKAISSIPDFFNKQATKPELVVIKQYL